MRVLVTDAGFKNALGAIRNLSEHGVEVIAAAPTWLAQGFCSRFCNQRMVYPPPQDGEAFLAWLLTTVRSRHVDVVLPIGDATTAALSRFKPQLERLVKVPVADWESMRIASSKLETIRLARSIGMAVPRTYSSGEPVESFPIVIKSSLGSGHVRYVNDAVELAACDRGDAVVQEYVPGEGRAFFALFDHGTPRAVFMHRRNREYPTTGGASTAAESISDPVLAQLGLKLLVALRWHGVAMVEFKYDSRGEYSLMEINPKFWGSLDLSIAAGVEFPWLTVRMALGENYTPVLSFRVGAKFQWVVDDLLRVAARPRDFGVFIRDLRDPSVENDVRWTDPGPTVFSLLKTMLDAVRRFVSGTLRYPHGIAKSTHQRHQLDLLAGAPSKLTSSKP